MAKKEASAHSLVLNIIKTSGSKEEVIRKLKEIDDKGGGTKWGDPGYMKKDIFNGLISACLGVPSLLFAMGGTASLGPVGILPGLVGLYLTGQIFHLRATKYDKFHMLEFYENKIKLKKKALEVALKKEKNPKVKEEIQARIKEADKCIKLIEKERRKLLPSRVRKSIPDDDLLDDMDLDIDFDWDDEDDWVDIDDIEIEEAANEQLYPVFIVNTFNHQMVGKVITGFTGDKYSHSLLSLDSRLNRMYSFNGFDKYVDGGLDRSGFGGLTVETIDKYIKLNPDTDIMVSCFFVKEKEYRKLKSTLDEFLNNYKITRYDLANIFNMALNKARTTKDKNKLVCSQFVDVVLKLCDIDLETGSSNLVTPGKLSRIKNPRVYLVYEGKAVDYNYKEVDKKLSKLKVKPIKETYIEEKVTSNDQGDIIISKKDKVDIEAEHAISKKLYPVYKKQGNLEAMKYEADKLYYLNSLVEKKMNSTREGTKKKEDLILLRSKLLNEFALYVRYISSKDKSYNFEVHYKESSFCKAELRINHSTVKAITTSIQKILILMA